MKNSSIVLKKYLFYITLAVILGCSRSHPHILTSSEADKKFIKTLKEENNYDVITNRVDNTLWIYHAMKEPIVDIKASDDGPKQSNKAKESVSVKYADTNFKDKTFFVEYDIANEKTYSKDYGYTSTYTDEYQKRQSNILSVIGRSYFDVENTEKEKTPEFVVLIIADINKGIEIECTIYFQDLKRAMAILADLTQEEFTKRYVVDVKGSQTIINDTKGEHIEFKTIVLPEFLAKQITNRINFKYMRSSFPPSADTVKELSQIAAETFDAYQFKDYQGLELKDLANEKIVTLTPAEIEKIFKDTPQGKFITIKFN